MPKRIIRIDASLLKESDCSEKVNNTLVLGLRSALNNNDIEFGSAFHLFVSTMKREKNEGIALNKAREFFRNKQMYVKPKKQYLTENYLIKVCLSYWQDVGERDDFETLVVDDVGPLVELKFSIPYYSDDDVEVLLVGTIDDICKARGGGYAIRDYKTTSSWDVSEYFKPYKLSTQLMFYRVALKKYAEMYPSSIWFDVNRFNPACFIQGVFLKGKDAFEFHRSEMYHFKEERLFEFELLLNNKVNEILKMIKGHTVPQKDGLINGACGNWNGCKYSVLCGASDEVARGHAMKNNFVVWEYDPSKFGE